MCIRDRFRAYHATILDAIQKSGAAISHHHGIGKMFACLLYTSQRKRPRFMDFPAACPRRRRLRFLLSLNRLTRLPRNFHKSYPNEIKKADTVTAKLPGNPKSPRTGNASDLALWISLLTSTNARTAFARLCSFLICFFSLMIVVFD